MADARSLRVLFLAAEAAPYAKVGGLGDVAGALPSALRRLGHDVRVMLPRYGQIDRRRLRPCAGVVDLELPGSDDRFSLLESAGSAVRAYFIDQPAHFERNGVYGFPDDFQRFAYFSRAALWAVDALKWIPDVVHVNDWHTAFVPYWMAVDAGLPASLREAASVLTIHNLGYQCGFDPAWLNPAWVPPGTLWQDRNGWFNVLSQGIARANLVTTVSERYAEEITTPDYGEGLDDLLTLRSNSLRGILNGIDIEAFNPATDSAIPTHFSATDLEGKAACKAALQLEAGFDRGPRRPLLGIVGRLFDQKGFDLIAEMLERVLAEVDIQIVILGTGEAHHEATLRRLASRNRRQIALFLRYDAELAQRIYAGADMFLMPSRYEPCGLGQMIALRYGTVPIVRATGGLADTVIDYQGMTGRGTGFTFKRYDAMSLVMALGRALEVYRHQDRWRALQVQGMQQNFSWEASAERYVEAYRAAILARRIERTASVTVEPAR